MHQINSYLKNNSWMGVRLKVIRVQIFSYASHPYSFFHTIFHRYYTLKPMYIVKKNYYIENKISKITNLKFLYIWLLLILNPFVVIPLLIFSFSQLSLMLDCLLIFSIRLLSTLVTFCKSYGWQCNFFELRRNMDITFCSDQ